MFWHGTGGHKRPCGSHAGAVFPQTAPARTNSLFMFQAMVTSFHSPRTFSNPRSENCRKPITDLMIPCQIEVLPPAEHTIHQIDRNDPIQPPQPHVRQPLDIRHKPAAPTIYNSVRAKNSRSRF